MFTVTPEVAQAAYAKTQTRIPPGQAQRFNLGDKYVANNITGICNGHFAMWMYFRTPEGYPNGWTELANLDARNDANAFTYYIDASKGKRFMTFGAFGPIHIVFPDASYFVANDLSQCWKLPKWSNAYEAEQKSTAILWSKEGRTAVYDGPVGDLGSGPFINHNRIEIDWVTGFPKLITWSQVLPMPPGVNLPFSAYGKGLVLFESCDAITPPDNVFQLPPSCDSPLLWMDTSTMSSIYEPNNPLQPGQYFPYPFMELLNSK